MNKFNKLILFSKTKLIKLLTAIAIVNIFFSCSATRFIDDDQALVRESDIVFKDASALEEQSYLKYDLEGIRSQIPPKRFLGITRDFYYFRNSQEGDTTKWNKFVLKNIANKPAILDSAIVENTAQRMQQYLKNKKGFYNAKVDYEIKVFNKTARIKFLVNPKERYKVNKVNYHCKNEEINKIINEDVKTRLINPGDPVDANLFNAEKQRLFQTLQNRGFANFIADNIAIKADSTFGDHKMDVLFEISANADSESFQKYAIGKINVFTDYSQDKTYPNVPHKVLNGKNYYSTTKDFVTRPRALDRHIFLKVGEFYSRDDHYKTIRKLSEFSTYKFVKLTPTNDVRNDSIINYNVFLTPYKHRWISDIGSEAFYASINLAKQQLFGFSLNSSLVNRNAFGGSERYSLSAEVGTEFQASNNFRPNSYRFGLSQNLLIPKQVDYLGLFGLIYSSNKIDQEKKSLQQVATKTNITVSANYQDVLDQYLIRSANASIAYNYRPNDNLNVTLTPTGVNLFDYTLRPVFQERVDSIPLLQNSFRNNFFTGILFKEFSAIYTKPENYRGISYALYGDIELSGAEVFLLNELSNAITNRNDVWGLSDNLDFTKFFKIEFDGRLYKKLNQTSALATRFNVGYSAPFGNKQLNQTVPFIRQFFVGGPNSIRAWSSRELGAGGYSELLLNPTDQRFYQAGDIKLEFNIEYRTDIFWIIEGAFFLDGGNVWLIKDDPERPDSKFTSEFYKQIALGWGWGLRFDFTYFNLRFDFAYILRNPYPSDLGTYFISPINQGVLGNAHIAINYPF